MESLYDLAIKEIEHCNKCGFCLPVCPTYRLTGNEVDSPRGRIAMVEGVLNDEIAAHLGLEESLSYCLGCRACETACPSGVQYHRVLEAGKLVLDRSRPRHRGMTFLPRALLKMTRHPKRMKQFASWAKRTANWPVPKDARSLLPMLTYEEEYLPGVVSSSAAHDEAAFFRGCVQEALYGDANHAARQLLQGLGVALREPSGQRCCGALDMHAGRRDEAKRLAKTNIRAFESSGSLPILNTAGGCGAMLAEYGDLLSDEPGWRERAETFSSRVQDWSQVVMERALDTTFEGAGETVTLQNSCHLVNVEKGGEAPAVLMQWVKSDTFQPIDSQDRCCGSAGIYNIQHPEFANRLLDQKMSDVSEVQPDRIIVVNPGCQLQMTLGVAQSDRVVPVEHLARYLYRAFLRAQRQPQSTDKIN